MATNIYYDNFLQHGYARANFCMDPERWAVIVMINGDNLWRVTYNEDAAISDEEAVSRIPARLAELLPGSGGYEIDAASPYRVHERASPGFRKGRVLLAGDAAHVCNPCGGLGLTTGFMDAAALIDALHAVMRDKCDAVILDDYANERRRVFLEISSPRASEYKRMIGESRPDYRERDMENLRQIAADPERVRRSMLAPYKIRGNPLLNIEGRCN